MKLDLNNLNDKVSAANSALRLSELNKENEHIQRVIQEVNRESAERDATLVSGAKSNIMQEELLRQQLKGMQEQNELLCNNYEKLKEVYDAQVIANEEAKEELKRSKKYNRRMMIIAIIAMFAAIVSASDVIL